ncbi:MAG: hypothetical protein GY807_24820 [Gammaproteobacteria bacterium]|nr:hypothetical protein [Gammaproteobacteria bacterium]
MTDTDQGQIYELIPKIMGDIGHVAKDQTNSFHRYKFRGIDAVYDCVGPVLAKLGVHILPIVLEHVVSDIVVVSTDKGGKRQEKSACRVILKVAYRFTAPDGSYVEAITIGESMDTGDKAASKAMSAAMKYAVWQTFCIPTKGQQGDIENDSYEREIVQQTPKPAPAPANPIADKLKALVTTFGKEACAAAKLRLINAEGENFTKDDAITRMGDANELERMLNAGE